ncbi:MAG: PD40 domain-containing protein [Thermoplasmata archaeon]|nr:MAG: PD40 domain-containing protein [Thermoplasmata archaeon]
MSWSPDGTSIAITSGPYNTVYMYLWIIDISVDENNKVQGSNARKVIPDNIRPGYAVWSPNGDVIAYTKGSSYIGDPPCSIWLYNVADESTQKIYEDPDDGLESLTWDPTGTKLAFVKDAKRVDSTWTAAEIQIFDTTLNSVTTVFTFPLMFPYYYGGGLDWANVDDKLAFNLNQNIVVLDLDENSGPVSTNSGPAVYPTWSPDDSKITFETGEQGPGRKSRRVIKTIDLSTGDLEKLVEGRQPD